MFFTRSEEMSGYERYVFMLCLIVFIALTALFSVMLAVMLKQGHKAIFHGLEDERIKKEYTKEMKSSKAVKVISGVFVTLVLVVVFAVFGFSVYVGAMGDTVTGDMVVPKVVLSESMSFKREENKYLEQNRLDDQINMFDLIFVEALPAENELELYDIVVYEYEDELIVHRIIGIEEPNEKHPECRHFLLRGDAVKFSDEFPVLYSQMRGIYRGERIEYVGSFFAFMQSPAGYLCILLIIFAVISTPIAEKKLWNAKLARLRAIGFIPEDPNDKTPKGEGDKSGKKKEKPARYKSSKAHNGGTSGIAGKENPKHANIKRRVEII